MGIEILPPDVNLSDHEFTVVEGNIRFGLDAVKGVGYQAVEAIKQAREGDGSGLAQTFSSLWDFCERVDNRTVNKKAIEALVKCGAFGSTGATRKGMLEVLEQAQGAGQKIQQDAQIGQGSIFDLDTPPAPAGSSGLTGEPTQSGGGPPNAAAAGFGVGLGRPTHPPIPTEEFDQAELLAVEKEAIGLFISAHPLKPLREALRARVDCSLSALADRRDKDLVIVGGIITEAKRIRTRNGDPMMFATLDDLAGAVEMIVFGKAIAEHEAALAVDKVVLVRGRVDHKEAGKTCLVVQSVEAFAPSEEEIERARTKADVAAKTATALAHPVRLRVDVAAIGASAIDDCKQLIEENPGPAEVELEISTSTGTRRVRLGETYRVQHTPTLRAELEQALAPVAAAAAAG
jgi:DNA polymerase-3 subunit alpha